MEKAVLVDVDGVLHPYSKGWCGGRLYDDPKPEAREFLRSLKSKGYQVIIFSARFYDMRLENTGFDMMSEVVGWLEKHDLPYDDISCVKVPSVALIDDRGVHFDGTNWNQMLEQVDRLAKYDGCEQCKVI